MKHVSKVLALVLAIAVLAAMMAACGGSKDFLEGTWKQTDEVNGNWTFEFDGAGKCWLTGDYLSRSEGTYTLDEDAKTVSIKIDIWDNANDYTYTLDGDNLDLEATYSSYHLVKQ